MRHAANFRQQEQFLRDRLLYIKSKAEAGDYAVAMEALHKAKGSWSDSIYFTALERQVGNLLTLSRRNALTDERRAEILEPVSGIIECALARLTSPTAQPAVPKAAPAPVVRAIATQKSPASDPGPEAEEKEVALDNLKLQYFKQAGEFLAKGEYELALAEIRRVFVIDPDNQMAKQYEAIVEKLRTVSGRPADGEGTPPVSARPMDGDPGTPAPRARLWETSAPAPLVEEGGIPDNEVAPPEPVENEALPGPTQVASEPLHPAPELSSFPQQSEIDTSPPSDEVTFRRKSQGIQPGHQSPDLPPFPQALPWEVSEETPEVRPARSSPRVTRAVIIAGAALVIITGGIVLSSIESTNEQPPAQATQSSASKGAVTEPGASAEQAAVPASDNRSPEIKDMSTPTTSSGRSSSDLSRGRSSAPEKPAERQLRQSRSSERAGGAKTEDVTPEEVRVTTGPETVLKASSQPRPAEPVATAPPEESKPEPFIAVEKEPQLVKLQTPVIPDMAWQSGNEVQVVARVKIDPEGKPLGVTILKSSNSVINGAVTQALMTSTFTPGIMGRAPVTAYVTIPLKFKRGG